MFSKIWALILSFIEWLQELPSRMVTWPGRFKRWSIRKFWEFIAWVKDLPRRIKAAFFQVSEYLFDKAWTLQWRFKRFLRRILGPVAAVLLAKIDKSPDKYPPNKLTIRGRGRKVAIFARQLASMAKGGVPLVQSMEVLAEQPEDPRLGYVASQLASKMCQGYSMSKAASEYSLIFPPVFYYLVKSGEDTGRINEVLDRLADLLEAEESLVKRVKGALSYPIFIACFTFVLTIGLFTTVLPGFADFYRDFDVPLPVVTSILMTLTDWIRSPWLWFFSLLLVFGTVKIIKLGWEHPIHRIQMYRFITAIPLVGTILEQSSLARFCWIMELTSDAGLDLMRSVRLAALASGSATLIADNKRLHQGLTDGVALTEMMEISPHLYPNLLRQMLMMGEETSKISEACGRAGAWFEQEADAKIETFSTALEPIMMGGISLVVGTIVMAVFMPLYGLLDKLGV